MINRAFGAISKKGRRFTGAVLGVFAATGDNGMKTAWV